jgi:hypothetical protein
MRPYILVAGLGTLIYVGLMLAEAAISGVSSRFFALLSNLFAAVFLFGAYAVVREHSSRTKRRVKWPPELERTAGGTRRETYGANAHSG